MVEKGEVRVCAWMCAHMCVFVWGLAEREKSWVNLEDTKKRQESFRGKGSSWQPSEEHYENKFFFGALKALSFFGVTRSFVWHKKKMELQSISYGCKCFFSVWQITHRQPHRWVCHSCQPSTDSSRNCSGYWVTSVFGKMAKVSIIMQPEHQHPIHNVTQSKYKILFKAQKFSL